MKKIEEMIELVPSKKMGKLYLVHLDGMYMDLVVFYEPVRCAGLGLEDRWQCCVYSDVLHQYDVLFSSKSLDDVKEFLYSSFKALEDEKILPFIRRELEYTLDYFDKLQNTSIFSGFLPDRVLSREVTDGLRDVKSSVGMIQSKLREINELVIRSQEST